MTTALAVPSRFPLLWHINLLNSIYYRLSFLLPKYFLKLTFSHMGKISPLAHTEVTNFPSTEATHLLKAVKFYGALHLQ